MKYLTTIIYWGFIEFLLVNDPPFIVFLKEHILIRCLQLTFSLPRTEVCKIISFLLTKNNEKPRVYRITLSLAYPMQHSFTLKNNHLTDITNPFTNCQ